jgi:hypothetical protein
MRMRAGRQFATGLIVTLSFFVTSCTSVNVKSYGRNAMLAEAVSKEFQERDVRVALESTGSLVVNFVNSPLNNRLQGERRSRAEATVKFVIANYQQLSKVREIWITFLWEETSYLIVKKTRGWDYYGFDTKGIALNVPQSDDTSFIPGEAETLVNYIAEENVSYISTPPLFLAGHLDNGLSLTPRFVIPGDARLAKATRGPEEVILNFTSISKVRHFPTPTAIRLLSDDQEAFTASRTFTVIVDRDRTVTENLNLRLSYDEFRKFAQGEKLTIELGKTVFQLSEVQARAIRKMTTYVST